ncbi:glutaminase [Bacillus pakistanensis]|uniref:Glutaminase n=1 Tax=Rossellomorea pakistanensis TaxID=992288 RepID=A0ABS2NFR5_9BACI|nr:glutaminase A [Bacillus pakistanensis]MBM7586687.1 glutaminase [Bacillus pakistanensis]
MNCKNNEELANLVEEARVYTKYGKLVDYIPALSRENKSDLSISIYNLNGEFFYAGDYLKKFTLQSISKVITLALVLMDKGESEVFSKVGMEPTGDPFNSIAKLESNRLNKPLNPMINAGALAVTNMIPGRNVEEKWNKLIHFVAELTNDNEVSCNQRVEKSEFETAFLNRALCYFMKQHKVIDGDVEELLSLYTKQCSIEMNCRDLARIGAVFANDGCDLETGKCIITKDIARVCKTFMVTCGMYNSSGEFAMKVGIPAKSGVSGGIMGAIPQKCGIGIFGPSLDQTGNSIAGLKLLEIMSKRYSWSIF